MVEQNEGIVDAIVAACATAWPDVRLTRDAVVQRVRQLDMHDTTHLADLGLACACLAGDAAALRALEQAIAGEARSAVKKLRRPAWLADEVQQELAQRLLVGDDGKSPRLATYAGQSALGRWLGVAAMRTALNLTRRRKQETPLDEEDGQQLAAMVDSELAPQLAIVRDRYKREVELSVREAFDALDDARDRNLLRLYYFDRVGLDRLAQMFGVHASTVSRWLMALRETIMDDTRFRLAERLGMAGNFNDVDSLIRAVRSELDITLSRILRPSA